MASENFVTISGLKPVSVYHVRLLASNSLGQSDCSEVVTVATSEETPGGPPQYIKAMPLSSTSVKVSMRMFNLENILK